MESVGHTVQMRGFFKSFILRDFEPYRPALISIETSNMKKIFNSSEPINPIPHGLWEIRYHTGGHNVHALIFSL